MDEYFNSKKYIILLIFICILFTIIIIKSFDYLPKPINNEVLDNHSTSSYKNFDVNSQNNTQEITQNEDSNIEEDNENEDDEEEEEEDSEVDNNTDIKHKSGHIDFSSRDYHNTENFIEIPAPKGSAEEIIEAR